MPGQSGNPGGRPKGIVAKVKELGGEDGAEYLAILDGIARGSLKIQVLVDGEPVDITPSFKERREAARELLDRGFGKAAQPITGDDGGPVRVIRVDLE